MARPCGCGGGGLTVRCSTGIQCTGLGTTTDPLTIQWEVPLGTAACNAVMNCVGSRLGPGLIINDGLLSTRLAPGGGLEFDVAGAMRVTGVTPGGNPATVAALEQINQDVIGGAIGGGYMIKPPNLMRSFEYGVSANLHFMHVPVRFLSDATPVVYFQETIDNVTPPFPGAHVQDQDPHRWKIFANKPGHQILPSGDNTVTYEDPKEGWFGYLEPGEPNLVFLADVLREFGGKIVLVLDLRFPATNSQGFFTHPTPWWRLSIFRQRLVWMIQDLGLSQSVIITTSKPFTKDWGQEDPTRTFDNLKYFSDRGMKVGPYLESLEAANQYPAGPTWPATWTWVFLSWAIPSGILRSYVTHTAGDPAKPLNTILFVVTRQYLRQAVVNSAEQTPGAVGVGAKGVISADPEYYLARSQYRYRKGDNTWYFSTISHGLLPHEHENLVNMNCLRRGHHLAHYRSMWFGDLNYRPPDPISNTGFTLQGWISPSDPTVANNRFYDLGMGFDQPPGPNGYGWMAIAFCVATDHIFQAYAGTTPPPGVDYSRDNGYILLLDTNGWLFPWRIDEGKITKMAPEQNPYGGPVYAGTGPGQSGDPRRGRPYYFRIGINANGLKVSKITNPGSPTTGAAIFTLTDEGARQYRGGFVYFGRRGQGWNGFIDDPKLGFNSAPPIGP